MQKHPAGNTEQTVGVLKRFVALVIDAIVVAVPVGLLFSVLGAGMASVGGRGGLMAFGGIAQVLGPLIGFGYYIVLEAVFGYTLGKMVLGLVVVSEDGSSIGWGESLIRNVLRVVDGLFAYLVGAIVIWISDDKQRIGDIAGSTLVVEQA